MNRLEAEYREGARDAEAGRAPKPRPRGNRTRMLYRSYLVGYNEAASRMRRQRQLAQLELFR